MGTLKVLLFVLLLPVALGAEELRLSAIGLRLDYPGRNQPREKRWLSSADPKYSRGETNRAAKARDVVLMKEGKGKTLTISVSDRPNDEALFTENDLAQMQNVGAGYRTLSKGFINFLGTRTYRVTAQNTNAEVQGHAVAYHFHTNNLEYRIFAATFSDGPPEKDSEISAILKSLKFIK